MGGTPVVSRFDFCVLEMMEFFVIITSGKIYKYINTRYFKFKSCSFTSVIS